MPSRKFQINERLLILVMVICVCFTSIKIYYIAYKKTPWEMDTNPNSVALINHIICNTRL